MFPKWVFLIALLAVAVGVYLLPSLIDPEPFIFENPPPLVGPLAVNRNLQQGIRLFYGHLKGPESFTSDNEGNLYTGTVDGKVWVIHGEQLSFITQMGQNLAECGTPDLEPICGRPHGIRMASDGYLIVADSYFGLYRVNPQTGEKNILISNKEGLDGISFRFLNGLELSKNGTIYFTDSSSKWGRQHHRYEDPSRDRYGFALDPASGLFQLLSRDLSIFDPSNSQSAEIIVMNIPRMWCILGRRRTVKT